MGLDKIWVYGEAKTQQWIDGFHTGYNLVALKDVYEAFGDEWVKESMDRGLEYYRENLFEPGGIAKYYHDRMYPLDPHSTALGIITMVKLRPGDPDAVALAESLLEWADRHMRSPQGYYFYQKHRWWTNRISYMRWTQAWMPNIQWQRCSPSPASANGQRGIS